MAPVMLLNCARSEKYAQMAQWRVRAEALIHWLKLFWNSFSQILVVEKIFWNYIFSQISHWISIQASKINVLVIVTHRLLSRPGFHTKLGTCDSHFSACKRQFNKIQWLSRTFLVIFKGTFISSSVSVKSFGISSRRILIKAFLWAKIFLEYVKWFSRTFPRLLLKLNEIQAHPSAWNSSPEIPDSMHYAKDTNISCSTSQQPMWAMDFIEIANSKVDEQLLHPWLIICLYSYRCQSIYRGD